MRLLVIVGPTAAGKSALALRAARELGGEVVSADSMQVYRGFDIGTAKPTPEERAGVPHHLLDLADPSEVFSAARFVEAADRAIAEVIARGRRPVVVGGSGLYVRALLRGLFEAPPADPERRAAHAELRRREGPGALHAALSRVDPETAAALNVNDHVRVSRALEVFEQTGQPVSALRRAHGFKAQRYAHVTVGLDPGREALAARIDERVDGMLERGWLDEVVRLCAEGHGESHAMGALGYRQLRAHLVGRLDLSEAVRQTRRETKRFARRQRAWFAAETAVVWHPDAAAVSLPGLAAALDEATEEAEEEHRGGRPGPGV